MIQGMILYIQQNGPQILLQIRFIHNALPCCLYDISSYFVYFIFQIPHTICPLCIYQNTAF